MSFENYTSSEYRSAPVPIPAERSASPETSSQESYPDGFFPSLQICCHLLLSKVLRNEHQRALVCELSAGDTQLMVNYLDLVARDANIFEANDRRRAVALLCKLAKSSQVFPQCYELTGVEDSGDLIGSGGFADVYKGKYRGQTVCLKVFRVCHEPRDSDRLAKAHAHELTLWAHLQHKNVLPFYGVYYLGGTLKKLCLISPWIEGGNLRNYLAKFPETPRMVFISDVLDGLSHLHGLQIVHGDLKAENILISNNGYALITDFGVSSITATLQLVSVTSLGGTPRWMAPELLTANGEPRATTFCDIWSFASLCYEILANKMPFYQYKDFQMVAAMMRKETPLRPGSVGREEFSDQLWDLLERCWNYIPTDRPTCKMLQDCIMEIGTQGERSRAVEVEDSGGFGATTREGSNARLDYVRLRDVLFRISARDTGPLPTEKSASDIQLTAHRPGHSPFPQPLRQHAGAMAHPSSSQANASVSSIKPTPKAERIKPDVPKPQTRVSSDVSTLARFTASVSLGSIETGVVNAIKGIRRDDIIIAFMGPTGSGKSYFIDLLTGQPGRRAGNSLKSVTSQIQLSRVKHPKYGDRIVLVDTPGFDDTSRTDKQVLQMIGDWLQKTYERGVKLSGMFYLHRITDNRMAGSPYKHIRMFEELCGDEVMSHVTLISTMWEKVKHDVGEAREGELVNKFWKVLIDKGSKVNRLERSTSGSAWAIVNQLIKDKEEREAVLLQEELVQLGIKLNETAAGKAIYDSLQKQLADQKDLLMSLLPQMEKMNDPASAKELQKVFKKSVAQFHRTFEEVNKLKIPLGQRVKIFFLGKKTRARAVRVEGED